MSLMYTYRVLTILNQFTHSNSQLTISKLIEMVYWLSTKKISIEILQVLELTDSKYVDESILCLSLKLIFNKNIKFT